MRHRDIGFKSESFVDLMVYLHYAVDVILQYNYVSYTASTVVIDHASKHEHKNYKFYVS